MTRFPSSLYAAFTAAACFSAFLFVAQPVQAQKVYKWTDENGQVHYGTTPPPKQQTESVRLQRAPTPSASTAPSSGTENANDENATSGEKPEMTAEKRAELTTYCKGLRDRNSTLANRGGRVIQRNPDGSQETLNADRINQELAKGRADETKFCSANGI